MIQLISRDKKTLLAGGIFVVFWLLFVVIAEPTYLENKRAEQKIKEKILFIQKYYEILHLL